MGDGFVSLAGTTESGAYLPRRRGAGRAWTYLRPAKPRLARNRCLCYDGGVQKVPYRATWTWGAGLTKTGIAAFVGENEIPVGIHLRRQMRKRPLAVLRGAR